MAAKAPTAPQLHWHGPCSLTRQGGGRLKGDLSVNDSSNPLTWITTYVIILLLVLFGSDARSAPLGTDELVVGRDAGVGSEQQEFPADRHHLDAAHHLPLDMRGSVMALRIARAEKTAAVAHPLLP